ncbi:MAG TPA: nuclear transport factor 2 family protein [bacterium]|nr:nuclear transport factor 2 family protein [bacterium]
MQATRFGGTLLVTTTLVAGIGCARSASHPSVEQDMIGIERLHQQDREATLSDSADQLAKLWDKDAVRFLAGRPAEIGAAVIYADDKRWEMSSGRERSLCADYEIQDVQIAGDWAFEWGYFSYKTSKGGKVSIGYGTGMRVMKRQSDGTWRFARVMSLLAPSASAAVLKHPCQ